MSPRAALLALALAAGAASWTGLAPPPLPAPRPAPDADPLVPQRADYDALEIEGFTVLIERAFAGSLLARRALAALRYDLRRVSELVPAPALAELRSVPIWVTRELPPRMGWTGAGLAYHQSREWVTQAGYGPERAGAVEVCNAANYLLWRAEQPMGILHELAHAYHHRLAGAHDRIRNRFLAARDSGAYDRVDYALADEPRQAYAMTNEREYFAELTEAYFGLNDFGPRTRDELQRLDPAGADLVAELWALDADAIARLKR